MSADLKVDYHEVRAVASGLSRASTRMSMILAHARVVVTELTSSGFRTDKASVELETQFEKLRLNLADAVKALDNFGEFLRGVANAYEKADKDLAEKLGGGGAPGELRIDLHELDGLKTNLLGTARALKDVKGVSDRLSESVLGKWNVADAVGDFTKDWDVHREKMLHGVNELHDAFGTIVTAMTDIDSQLLKALTGGTP